jgi:hypothetical protein
MKEHLRTGPSPAGMSYMKEHLRPLFESPGPALVSHQGILP